jgi:hypothetical protein
MNKPHYPTLKFLSIVLISFITLVIAHEGTHIALNEFRFTGFCFLNCPPVESTGLLGNTFTTAPPIGIYLTKPINPLAANELIAGWTGIITFLITFTIGIIHITPKTESEKGLQVK